MSFPVQHAVNAKSLASSAVSRHELEALTSAPRTTSRLLQAAAPGYEGANAMPDISNFNGGDWVEDPSPASIVPRRKASWPRLPNKTAFSPS